jgi:hypothetical protein
MGLLEHALPENPALKHGRSADDHFHDTVIEWGVAQGSRSSFDLSARAMVGNMFGESLRDAWFDSAHRPSLTSNPYV